MRFLESRWTIMDGQSEDQVQAFFVGILDEPSTKFIGAPGSPAEIQGNGICVMGDIVTVVCLSDSKGRPTQDEILAFIGDA